MIYISIDIETTGLNPEKCSILEIGAILEDTSKKLSYNNIPKWHKYIRHTNIIGEEYALNLNASIIDIINENTHEDIIDLEDVSTDFANWLFFNGFEIEKNGVIYINVAGKNFSTFDFNFIKKIPYWSDLIRVRHRILDPTMYYINWEKDEYLPDLKECLNRHNIQKEISHLAIDDAWDVIQLLRKMY